MSGKDIFKPRDGKAAVPSEAVRVNEDTIVKAIQDTTTTDEKSLSFPKRPAFGSNGEGVRLWANYVEISLASHKILHRYTIEIKPDVQGKKAARVVQLFLQSPTINSFRKDIVTDFRSTLLSLREITDRSPVTISYYAEGETRARENARQYTISFSSYRGLSVNDLNDYLGSVTASEPYAFKDEMVQALNILVNHFSKNDPRSVTVGAGKVFQQTGAPSVDLRAGLKAVRGFYASVRLATSRPLVNVNVSHAVFYKEGPLLYLVREYRDKHRAKGDVMRRLELFLKRLRVRPEHLSETIKEGEFVSRVKTIFGLATQKDGKDLDHPPEVPKFAANSREVKFWWRKPGKEEYISVYDYFKTKYKEALKMPDEPVINVGTLEKPSYLPLEKCTVLPNQVAKTRLDPGQTALMIRFAIGGRKPAAVAKDIEDHGFNTVGLCSRNADLQRFGVSVSPGHHFPKLIAVDGRRLNTPKVKYKAGGCASVFNGGWTLKGIQFCESGASKKWACIGVDMSSGSIQSERLEGFTTRFTAELRSNGVAHSKPISMGEGPFALKERKDCDHILQTAQDKGVCLLIIVLPQKVDAEVYGIIKEYGDTRYGIATICIDGTNQFSPQYLANVTMKFNLKMGGCNQAVDLNKISLNFNETMIVGIDVTHPAPGSSEDALSIAGMVASVDSSLGQWPAVIRRQKKQREEMVSDLDEMLKTCLNFWKRKNKGGCPKNIIVYRDGVSEGQFNTVLQKELTLLRAACKELYPPADQKKGLPKITVIIVVKRHHTRFYASRIEDADKKFNPKPGTIVDRGITEARNWDFFLQAHQAIQGTARPIHYFVAHDEIFQKMGTPYAVDNLEYLTHALSYTYGRATRAVSVCTPAYYADLVCDRARCYPDTSRIHRNLEHTMFYI
ncbi:Piwi-domain-containing protein [Hypoxylon sp. FL0543]|nr:Piwi-domain-containing protein [Hypoxylon sp. FL0543]